MALDWGKGFTGLKGSLTKKSGAPAYPSKRTMNLMVKDENRTDPKTAAIIAVCVTVVLLVFAKFFIYDYFARLVEKNMEVLQEQQIVEVLSSQLSDYDAVKAEYESYTAAGSTVSDEEGRVSVTSAIAALGIVDDTVIPRANVTQLGFGAGKLEISLNNVTLDAVGSLTSALYESDAVAGVSVYTAATDSESADVVNATLSVTLN